MSKTWTRTESSNSFLEPQPEEHVSEHQQMSRNGSSVRPSGKKMTTILLVLVIICGAAALYFYRQLSTYKVNPNKDNQQEVEKVVGQVGKLIFLPTGEQPTLATVSDPAQLKNQPFFAHAKIGDKVLVYPNSGKVILYDPVINKIVEVATINLH